MSGGRPGRTGGVRLAGTGMAVPGPKVSNDDLARVVDTNDEWISKRTGIKTRHIAPPELSMRDLAREALEQALERSGLEAGELDMVLLATLTPEMACPSSAARLVSEIGAAPAGAMDLSAACSGFVYGMNLAGALIETGMYRNVAVVGAETLSRITDWTDRRTCVLFGDGAGAAIFSASDDPEQGCLHQAMHSEGRLWKELYLPRTQADLPDDGDGFSGNLNTLQMNGREVFKFAVATTQAIIEQTLEKAGVTPEQLSMVVPHQSNIRIMEAARDKLGLPPEKMCINIQNYGNTSAASVPIALHELAEAGRLHAGDLVLTMAIGGGMTWGAGLWRI